MSNHFTNQINNITDKIADVDAKIAAAEAEVIGSSNVQNCCTNYLTKLNELKTNLELKKTKLEERVATLQALDWTTEEQSTVDSINTLFNGKYSNELEKNIKKSNNRSGFFSHYEEATTDFQREFVLKDFLNINSNDLLN